MTSLLNLSGRLLLLSGAAGAGKTSIASALTATHGFRKISTSRYLADIARVQGLPEERVVLQELGDALDVQTDFLWPVSVALEQVNEVVGEEVRGWLLDAVRKPQQVAHFRRAFAQVLHVHVTAPDDILRERYLQRQSLGDERDAGASYSALVSHPNEIASRSLGSIADLVYNSGDQSAGSIATDIARIT